MFTIFKNPKRKLLFRPKLGGWQPDPASKIYLKFERDSLALGKSPNQYQSGSDIDLRPYTSPRHNQLSTSTCVAQSTVKALEIKRIMKHGHKEHVDLSVLDLYWGARERMLPPQTNKDGGTYISLACDVLRKFGVCREDMHPFKTQNLYKAPPVMASREGRINRIEGHFKIKTQGNDRIDDMIFNLKAGNPVVFGTQVGTNWFRYVGGKNPLGIEKDPKGGHAMCCLPGTTIITKDGQEEIQNIELGTLVLTREGWFPVTATTERFVSEHIYKINSQLSIEPLYVTGEHPILVKKARKWDRVSRTDMTKFDFVNANEIKKGWYVQTVIDENIEDLNISTDFARLLGYYIGDGNLQIEKNKDGSKIKSIKFRLTYHRNDKKEIIDDLIKIINKEYPGTNHSIYEDKNSKTNIISFYNTELGCKILDLCGGPKEKEISKLIHLDPKLQLEIIKGWYKTDGCFKWLDNSKIFTASKKLADSLVIMLQRCRLTYGITKRNPYENIIRGKSYKCIGGYYIDFHSPKSKDRMYYDGNNIYTRITSISKKEYSGMVYNLEVDKCHEYIANNIITHNCVVGFVNGVFIVENSWGNSWGEDGFAYVSPDVFIHPSTRDIWVIVDGSEAWTEIQK